MQQQSDLNEPCEPESDFEPVDVPTVHYSFEDIFPSDYAEAPGNSSIISPDEEEIE